VLIDFSSPKALQANLDAAIAAQTPILIGTTGLAADHHAAIDAASAKVADAPDRQHLAGRLDACVLVK
jgi:4-hydroxy-tetrahydrodipicolinate reductase